MHKFQFSKQFSNSLIKFQKFSFPSIILRIKNFSNIENPNANLKRDKKEIQFGEGDQGKGLLKLYLKFTSISFEVRGKQLKGRYI